MGNFLSEKVTSSSFGEILCLFWTQISEKEVVVREVIEKAVAVGEREVSGRGNPERSASWNRECFIASGGF